MGVGYAVDLVVCSCLGVDMYDCVFPTRTARFGTPLLPSPVLTPRTLTHLHTTRANAPPHARHTGTALITEGSIQLKHAQFANDYRPIDPDCGCVVCQKYTRAYLHTVAAKEEVGGQLLSYHNIAYQMRCVSFIMSLL